MLYYLGKEIMEKIENKLITTYMCPDLDGVASAIAYAEYLNENGIKSFASIFGQPTVEARYVMDYLKVEISDKVIPFAEITLVDASTKFGLPKIIELYKVTEIIDHRKNTNLEYFSNLNNTQIELVGAAATLICEKFASSNTKISKNTAILLHQAIISNTLNLKANTTTEKDKQALVYLKSKVKIPEELTHSMFLAKSEMSGAKLAENIRGDIARAEFGAHSFLIGQLEMIGVAELVQSRKPEIIEILEEERVKYKMGHSFISLIDLETGKNTLICTEKVVQNMLENILHLRFDNNVATLNSLIMRKEITPLLREYLLSNK